MIKQREDLCSTTNKKVLPFVLYIGNLANDVKVSNPNQNPPPATSNNGNEAPENEHQIENLNVSNGVIGPGGMDVLSVPEVHVYVDDKHRLKVDTNKLVDAVDICFKLFILLNLDFPPEARHIWSFFQAYVYKILPDQVMMYKSVINVIKALDDITILDAPEELVLNSEDVEMEEMYV